MTIANLTIHPPSKRVERFETLVIGAGQAGLAVGYHLASRDVDFLILSDETRIGDNWRKRWDSLRLFTPARYSGLPGMPFPAAPAHLADKDEVAYYLEQYASRFDLPVRLNSKVRSISSDGEHFIVRIEGTETRLEASNIVVATGAFQRPHVPAIASRLTPSIVQLHSSEYRNPLALPDGPVLVVGAGNSGAQIALELAQHRKVWLAGRNTGHLSRRALGRDIFDWIWPVVTRVKKGGPGGDALIGIPEHTLQAAGIRRVGRLEDAQGGLPVCGDTVLEPRVVVWCTGFVPDYRWIELPIFSPNGYPRHDRGVIAEAPGLFFLGLRFQHRMTSSLIGGVGADAAFIAEQVAQRCEALLPA
jgi:putative flavoprotein involved in K+ transport